MIHRSVTTERASQRKQKKTHTHTGRNATTKNMNYNRYVEARTTRSDSTSISRAIFFPRQPQKTTSAPLYRTHPPPWASASFYAGAGTRIGGGSCYLPMSILFGTYVSSMASHDLPHRMAASRWYISPEFSRWQYSFTPAVPDTKSNTHTAGGRGTHTAGKEDAAAFQCFLRSVDPECAL